MLLRLVARLPGLTSSLLQNALAVPARTTRRIMPPAASAARLTAGVVSTGAREAVNGAVQVSASAGRFGRVAGSAMTPGIGRWHAGSRMHLGLRHPPDAPRRTAERLEAAARNVAAELAKHPDVLLAYWDAGLESLVVRTVEDTVSERVADRASELAAEHGLEHVGGRTPQHAHPGDVTNVRVNVAALAFDVAGIATAVAGRTALQPRAAEALVASVSVLREDSRVRAALSRMLGSDTVDLVLGAANAAVCGIARSPAPLLLDGALRVTYLVRSLAQLAAFEAVHDTLCSPDRPTVTGDGTVRPALRTSPGDSYSDAAVNGMLGGALATLLFTRSVGKAAETVLAGVPKAARYGPSAFTAVLAAALAREDVLVGDPGRLRRLELVDTVVLHSGALRSARRTVLEVHPDTTGWDHGRLWHAAMKTLSAAGAGAGAGAGATPVGEEPHLELRPVSAETSPEAGLMIASARGRDVGTVLVGWDVDPMAEASLDAARRAGLHVVVVDEHGLGEYGTLADQLISGEVPFAGTVAALQDEGRTVLTVARVPHDRTTHRTKTGPSARDVVDGLLRGDVAVAVTDEAGAVVWGADLLSLHGLDGVWRLLSAVSMSQAVSGWGRFFAEAGATLSELLVLTREAQSQQPASLEVRLSPVSLATAASLTWGWAAALAVAAGRPPRPEPRVPWHALPPEEVVARLRKVPRAAPTAWSVTRRRAGRLVRVVAGYPVLAPLRTGAQLARAVWAELDDPFTPVLVVGATASALLGSAVDAYLVVGAVGLNALVGGIQRLRAQKALFALVIQQRPMARRLEPSTGEVSVVEAARLTRGEAIELHINDVVPADARLLEADGCEVDESSLTGESLPTPKHVAAVPGAALADRRCMVYEGTTVVAGYARAVVVGTGHQTEAGRAATLAARVPVSAGVQARLQRLTRRVLPFTLAGGAAVAGLSLLRGRPMGTALQGGLAVAVAAVPEGMPLVATVAQMAAARRLSGLGVLVRTPRSLEALGRVNAVCFDKTGTLTENKLRVVSVVTASGDEHRTTDLEAHPVLRTAARACPGPTERTGNHAHATDEAVLAAAPRDTAWTTVKAEPFESSRGFAAAVGCGAHGDATLVVKGAPEVVLPYCPDADPAAVETAHALAARGLRLLAVARRPLADSEAADALDKPFELLELIGFVALADTPRVSSAPLVSGLREAGVRPVMLTGDHPETARSMAIALGWPCDVTVVTGHDLAELDRAGRARTLKNCDVVARVAPEQKLQVVEALREAGRVVGMVGDGANDAAAIRAADVGIGIGARGSAAARNAADLVITTSELSVLIDAIAEGRALWGSVADAISILLGGNAGEVGFSVLGTLLSGTSPLSTRQLLLVNLLTDMFPAMAIAVTPHDPKPASEENLSETHPVGRTTLGEPLAHEIRQRGLITGAGAVTAWLIGSLTPGSAQRTSTMSLCGVIGSQLAQTVIGRRDSPLILGTVIGTSAVLVALVQTPVVSRFFGCTPLGPLAWTGVATAIGASSLVPRLLPQADQLVSDLTSRLGSVLSARDGAPLRLLQLRTRRTSEPV
ncbi:cation-translocating P-type ATPase [Streptomyces sp. WMMB 322]|uniref:cation-translocating P-type ATPase n=1 Tax=Streptomyces sp. WMMB 322 TaxID=1286821 RepID=UPI000823D8A3|nr:cation-translocating P-type ATPase [Streptomyces sp. WMMB 322]SCK08898.1 cation-transporting ATPase I [Streptomyces sp. WMMB 322]